ncbi:MAG: hypothetical protein LBD84_04360 [Campylobacteraceae bacterium]|nr:hypothetical protein [Campylobacteraceae bacterium]
MLLLNSGGDTSELFPTTSQITASLLPNSFDAFIYILCVPSSKYSRLAPLAATIGSYNRNYYRLN